jgi:hypothetical protein
MDLRASLDNMQEQILLNVPGIELQPYSVQPVASC